MRLLVTIGGFTPAKNYGGPVVSISNMCKLLSDEFDIYIITVDHDLKSKQRFPNINEGWNDLGFAKVLYLRESEITLRKFDSITKEIRPDILYANSLFLAKFVIPLYILSKKYRIPLLVATRGELCKRPYSVKRYKKVPYTFFVKTFFNNKEVYYQATSEEERLQIRDILKVNKEKILYLNNIPAMPDTPVNRGKKEANSLRCIFISRIHPVKNLLFALQTLKEVRSKVEFHIFGNIEDTQYWDDCKKIIKTMPPNIIVKYMGIVNHSDIFETFSHYDVMFFPTKSENYGHVIVEAMQSLCPVLISDQTPWNDINNKAGWAIPLNKKADFVNRLEYLASMNEEEYSNLTNTCKLYINNKLNFSRYKQEYIEAFKKVRDL